MESLFKFPCPKNPSLMQLQEPLKVQKGREEAAVAFATLF